MTDPIADTGSPPETTDAARLNTIRQWGQELGFQALGFTGIDIARHGDYLTKWLEAGYHGEMEWMASHGQKRTHPDALVPGTCTVITARMDYLPAGDDPETVLASSEKAYIARYALGATITSWCVAGWPNWPNVSRRNLAAANIAPLWIALPSWSGHSLRTPGLAGLARTPCC